MADHSKYSINTHGIKLEKRAAQQYPRKQKHITWCNSITRMPGIDPILFSLTALLTQLLFPTSHLRCFKLSGHIYNIGVGGFKNKYEISYSFPVNEAFFYVYLFLCVYSIILSTFTSEHKT